MKTNGTELVFILDRSGSMSGLEADTIGGYNAMLAKQKNEEGEATVTTVLFNHDIDWLHDRIKIKGIAPITEQEYEVGGTTALLDAIGSTIHKIGNVQKRTSEEERAGKVLFVITTDGMENASREYDYGKIKAMIEHQKVKYDWEFIFLGANIDAVSTASKFGIQEDYAVNYHADSEGTQVNFQALNEAVTSFRKGRKLDRVWKESIEKDFDSRK
ncbi:VWA domain-containing protein [Sporosarcina sp. Marseille-Q4063]|uniref:vWA domain-containing protein n=1 Tax=Sporosarcina sp. Marseille-Q4063 TaxID=2810514 RepID=UPI001BAF64F7|nr:vWA domain-containing protein [Sporosarcina sp. Marseille-Q4063]QUW20449.1 VWA domain-containing protein [Sporosarcina sp. Marseille-Q4063]